MPEETPPILTSPEPPKPPVLPASVMPELVTPKPPILMMILVLVLILSLIGTAFFAFQNMQLQKQINSMKVQVSPLPAQTETPTATSNQTTDWKTYTNSNFTFKYPTFNNEITVEEKADSVTLGLPIEWEISFTRYPNTTPQKWFTENSNSIQSTNKPELVPIIFNNYEAFSYELDNDKISFQKTYLIQKNNDLYNISFTPLGESINDILSTFKFTN